MQILGVDYIWLLVGASAITGIWLIALAFQALKNDSIGRGGSAVIMLAILIAFVCMNVHAFQNQVSELSHIYNGWRIGLLVCLFFLVRGTLKERKKA